MNKYLLLTSDTIFSKPSGPLCDIFRPLVVSNLSRLSRETEFKLVLLPTPNMKNETTENALRLLSKEGVRFSHVLSNSKNSLNTLLRKDKSDLPRSVLISTQKEEIEFARENDLTFIHFGKARIKHARLNTTDWQKIFNILRFDQRTAYIKRKTSETDIALKLNLDGQGKARIKSPLGFLSHMLELFAKHSGFDIEATIAGDTDVDEHHTVEDTAIVLGQALHKALGNKKGITRYGFLLPMDEAHVETAIDLSGRSFLKWKAKFKREKIGDMPTELFNHFFKSFSDHAQCTLYVRAKGKNEHHLIEGIFKAVARSFKMAVRHDPDSAQVPSTKGLL